MNATKLLFLTMLLWNVCPFCKGDVWRPARLSLHSIDVRGGLVLDLPLFQVRLDARHVMPFWISHVLFTDYVGDVTSRFECLQLTTFVRPLPNGAFLCRLPNGSSIVFRPENGGLSSGINGYKLEIAGRGAFRLFVPNSIIFEYSNYNLQKIIYSDGLTLDIISKGGAICQILWNTRPILLAQYQNGLIASLEFPDGIRFSFLYTEGSPKQLREISAGVKTIYTVIHNQGLICGITAQSGTETRYKWARVKPFYRGGEFPTSAILVSDGAYSYDYSTADIWVDIRCKGKNTQRLLINALTGSHQLYGADNGT